MCRSLLAASDMLQRKVGSMLKADEQSLALGIDHGVEQGFMLDVMENLERLYPSLNLTVRVGFDDELLDCVESGELDFIYTGLVEPDLSRFSCRQIGQYDFVAVCHKDHPLASYDYLEVTDLYSHRQIWTRLHRTTDSKKVRFSDSFWQVSDYQAAVGLVRRGLGWTNCPRALAIDRIRSGELVILNHPKAVYRWPVGLLWRADYQPGPVMQHLMEAIASHYSRG